MICKELVKEFTDLKKGLYEGGEKRLSVKIDHVQCNSAINVHKVAIASWQLEQNGRVKTWCALFQKYSPVLMFSPTGQETWQIRNGIQLSLTQLFPSHTSKMCLHSPHFTSTVLLTLELSVHFPPNEFVESTSHLLSFFSVSYSLWE